MMLDEIIRIVPLFSGSSGNCVFLRFGHTRILIDVGRSAKQIVAALEQIGENPAHVDGILVTHDHSDHLSGLDVFVRKFGIHVYASTETWRGIHMCEAKPHAEALDHVIEPWRSFSIGEVEITPFPTPHDARGSLGYRLSALGKTVSVATDLGHFSDDVRRAITGSEAVLIEANYNYDMLISGPYPWSLKRRVGGDRGHLCNRDCAEAIRYLYDNGTRHFILGHLSQENNSPTVARNEITEYLTQYDLIAGEHFSMRVANRYCPTEPLVLEVAERLDYEDTPLSDLINRDRTPLSDLMNRDRSPLADPLRPELPGLGEPT
jgi:phosphoribosyl 1,2-cyclic phosphodiesterase